MRQAPAGVDITLGRLLPCRCTCPDQQAGRETGTSGHESPRPEVKISASSGESHPRSDCTLNPCQYREGRSGSCQERAPRCLQSLGLGSNQVFLTSLVLQCKSTSIPRWKGSATWISIPPNTPSANGILSIHGTTPNLQEVTRGWVCLEVLGGDQSIGPPLLPRRHMRSPDESPALCPADHQVFLGC